MDSKIKKIKTLHSKKNRSSLVNTSSHSLLASSSVKAETLAEDSTIHDETNQSSTKKKEEPVEVENNSDEAEEDSGARRC